MEVAPRFGRRGLRSTEGSEGCHRRAPPDRLLWGCFHFRGMLKPLVSGTESGAEEVDTAWVGRESFRAPLFLFPTSILAHGLLDWPRTGLTSADAACPRDTQTSVLYSQVFRLVLRKGSEDHGNLRISDSWTQQQDCGDHFPQVEFLRMCFK